jgi:hypothetical protein
VASACERAVWLRDLFDVLEPLVAMQDGQSRQNLAGKRPCPKPQRIEWKVIIEVAPKPKREKEPPKISAYLRLPIEPLIPFLESRRKDLTAWSVAKSVDNRQRTYTEVSWKRALAELINVDINTVHGWARDGALPEQQGERAAIELALMPYEIWPDWHELTGGLGENEEEGSCTASTC